MKDDAIERGWHKFFEVGIILKGIDGTIELIGGLFLWFASPAALDALVRWIFRGELIEDPQDWLANALLHITQNLTGDLHAYASAILVAHGAVKLVLIGALLREKLWAYPAAIAVFILFIISQLYELAFGFSFFLAALTVVDLLVVVLIAHEYLRVRKRAA